MADISSRHRLWGVVGIALLVLAAKAGAAADGFQPGQVEFLVGIEAFHAGYFDAALASFLEARRAGFATPSLEFNLGLSYYKLGRYKEAQATFERLRGAPDYADIAEFHLGLVASRLDQDDVALIHLRKAAATARSPKLKALAQVAIARLVGAAPQSNSSFYASAGLGYDSNPLLTSGDGHPPDQGPDGYAELVGAFDHTLGSRPGSSDQVRGNVYIREYRRDSELNQQDAELGLRHSIFSGADRYDIGAFGQTSYVGGDNLQSAGGLELQLGHRFAESNLNLHYRGARVAGGSGFTYSDGWQQLAGVDWSLPLGPGRLRAEYDAEFNDRTDLTAGSEFFSESPMRHAFSLRLEQPWNDRLGLQARAGYRYSRYRDPDRFMIDDTTLVTERRIEKLAQFSASARFRFNPAWDCLLQYEFSRNQSSISGFAYSRHLATFALEWMN